MNMFSANFRKFNFITVSKVKVSPDLQNATILVTIFYAKGDVKIVVEIQNTTDYIRDGLDLKLTRKITLKESLTGFNFVLMHISGNTYNINNTKGNIIHPNYTKTLPNMGMCRGEFTGNLIINFEILFPESLSIESIDKLLQIL